MTTKDTKVKLDPEVEKLIFDAASTANSVGIDQFVIDEDGVRGVDEARQVVMLLKSFNIQVPFEGLAVGEVKQLIQRYNAHKNNEPVSITLTLDEEFIAKIITFKSKGLSIEYRCMKPKRIEAPKNFKDVVMCSFELTDEALEMIKKGAMIMKSEEVMFTKEDDNDHVSLVISDINKSSFDYDIEGKLEADDPQCTFAFRFPIKQLLGAIKDADSNFVDIGMGKTLSVQKSGINIILPPRV